MSTVGVLVLSPQSGAAYVKYVNDTTVNVRTSLAITSADTIVSVYFKSLLSGTLIASTDNVGSQVSLLTLSGQSIGAIAGTIPQTLGTVAANTSYVLRYQSGSTAAVDDAILSLQLSQQLTNNTFFTNGIVPVVNPTSSLSYAYNSYGGITFTFTSFPLVVGQILPLAVANNAIQAGTLDTTSSDLTVFANLDFPFIAGQFLNLSLVALRTTTFTGTVYFNVTGAGTSVVLPISAVPAPTA